MNLFAAVENQDLKTLEQALNGGADPDERDAEPSPEEASNLRRAVHQIGDFALHGRKLGRTPLMHAAAAGWDAGVERLLAAGAEVEAADALKKTALVLAVEGGHRTTVERLLDAGANPNVKDGLGVPALTAAFEARSLDLARLLLARGASARPRAKPENQPLSALLDIFPSAEVPGVVMLSADEDEKEEIDVGEGMGLVLALLDNGADATGEGLLDQAIATDLPQLYDLLVAAGADPAAAGEEGSLFERAVSSGSTRLAKKFLAEGADPNGGESSILMMPVAGGRVDTVRWLLEVGADPERPINQDGDTPLMQCASPWFGNLEILSLLIEAGADLDRRNARGLTALGIAEGEGNAEAARVLRKAGASDPGTPVAEEEEAEEDFQEGPEDADPEPVERRRGLHETSGNSWEGLLVRGSAASVAAALGADEAVESVRELAVGEGFVEPPSDVLVLAELAGHPWIQVASSRRPDAERARWLSRAAGGRALYVGYNDTACASWYQLYEDGEVIEGFESTGEDFEGEELDDEEWDDEEWEEDERLDTRFESKLRDPESVDFSEWEDPDDFIDTFLREHDAYAPLVWLEREGDGSERRLRLGAWPEDVAGAGALAGLRLVVLRPRGIQRRWTTPDEATRRLLQAVDDKDPEAVRAALAAGADPGVVPEGERGTALGKAGCHPRVVQALLEGGANPDDAGEGPALVRVAGFLSIATRDALETMRLLIDAGADVNRADAEGKTPLHAASSASLAGVKLLLLAGADAGRRDGTDRSPRDLASLALEVHRTPEREEIVSLLARAEQGKVEIGESPAELVEGAVNPMAGLQEKLEGLGELFRSLEGAEASGAVGATAENPLGPPEVHLSDDPAPPDAEVEREANALAALGYARAGRWLIDEMPGVRLVGLVHQAERLVAAFYRHPALPRLVCDVVSRGADGSSLTLSNSPQGGELDQRPGARKVFLSEASAADLHGRILEERAVAVTPGEFRELFETMYREDMAWRTERGVTEDEVRAVARRGGGDVTGGMIGQVLDALKPPRKEES